MRCNFFEDYRSENRLDTGLAFDILGFIGVLSVVLLVVRFIFDALFFNLESTFGEMLVFSIIGGVVSLFGLSFGWSVYCYYKERDNTYSLFKTDALKKWYALTPERFVFSTEGSVVYYIHNEGSVAKDTYRYSGFEKYLDITKMYPETIIEALKYSRFIDSVFKGVEKEEKRSEEKAEAIQKQKDIIYANNELMRVMGSIQKDIDKIMVESNRVIVKEINKMAELNNSI